MNDNMNIHHVVRIEIDPGRDLGGAEARSIRVICADGSERRITAFGSRGPVPVTIRSKGDHVNYYRPPTQKCPACGGDGGFSAPVSMDPFTGSIREEVWACETCGGTGFVEIEPDDTDEDIYS